MSVYIAFDAESSQLYKSIRKVYKLETRLKGGINLGVRKLAEKTNEVSEKRHYFVYGAVFAIILFVLIFSASKIFFGGEEQKQALPDNETAAAQPETAATQAEQKITHPATEDKTVETVKIPFFTETIKLKGSDSGILKIFDMNGDSRKDIVYTNIDAQSYIYFNNGDGTLTLKDFPAPRSVTSFDCIDFNKDGFVDCAFGRTSDWNKLLINNKREEFNIRDEFNFIDVNNPEVKAVAWGDYNKDGYPDLAMVRDKEYGYIFINDKGESFIRNQQFDKKKSTALAWADLNNDGYPDLIEATYNDGILVYLNRGTAYKAIFENPVDISGLGLKTRAITTADFNNDGFVDIAVANYDQPSIIFFNYKNKTFVPTELDGKDFSVDIAAGDLNGDGYADIVLANYNSYNTIYINNKTNFIPVRLGDKDYNTNIGLLDINSDNKLDIAIGKFGKEAVVYKNS